MPQREFPAAPLVGVGAVVVDSEGRVLLVKRANEPAKGRWSLPGGLLELGESLERAVEREVFEETGLYVHAEATVEVINRIYTSEDRIQYHYVIVDYWCTVLSGEAYPASDAAEVCWATEAEWKDIAERSHFALEPVTIQVIEKGWSMARKAGVYGQEKSLLANRH